jgi:Tfp pilus assembly protein PilN
VIEKENGMNAGVGKDRLSRRARLSALFQGAVTILAFTESGRMRRLRLPKRVLLLFSLTLFVMMAGSTVSILVLFRGQVDVARMTYLERENRSLTSLLEGQAEQLSRLKLEVERLKEFEQNLRVVSGLESQATPMVGTGQGRGARQELRKKR